MKVIAREFSRQAGNEVLLRHHSLMERLRFTFTPNGKREFVPRDQVFPYFSFTVYCFYTKISSFMPVLSTRIVLDLF